MKKNNDLKKASFYYLIGTLFNKGISFLMVPVFTRIISVSDYGIVTTYNSWVGITMMFISLALYMGVRASFIDYKDKTNDFLSVIVTFTCIYACLFSAVILIAAKLLPINVNLSLICFCLVQAFASAIIENASMYCMMTYKYKIRTVLMILPNLVSTIVAIFLIMFVLKTDLYIGKIVATSSITLIIALIALVFIYKGSKVRFNKEYVSYALKISVPLVLHGIALNILSQSDRTMITIIRNSTENGIYGLIYNFGMIATVITTAFDGIWIPYFTNRMNEQSYDDINLFANKYVELMSAAMIGVVLIAPEIVKIMATEPYWEGISIIPPIVFSNYLIFLYTMYVNIEHYYKKTVFISLNTAIAAITNIVLNIYFIKKWGYVGAAYSTLISYILSLALHYNYARTLNKVLFPLKMYFLPGALVIMASIIFYIFINEWYIRWIIAILLMFIFLFKEKDFILKTIIKK